jgi:hypothetical protein
LGCKATTTKINYKIHTDAIQENIVLPRRLLAKDANVVYATEADVLNKALFGMTAKEWRSMNPQKEGNIRDYSNVTQLVCLSNLENINAEYIHKGISQSERLLLLNESAIRQMKSHRILEYGKSQSRLIIHVSMGVSPFSGQFYGDNDLILKWMVVNQASPYITPQIFHLPPLLSMTVCIG